MYFWNASVREFTNFKLNLADDIKLTKLTGILRHTKANNDNKKCSSLDYYKTFLVLQTRAL